MLPAVAMFHAGAFVLGEQAERGRKRQRAFVQEPHVRTAGPFDDIAYNVLCHGVDAKKFREECRCPIYPNQWNYWKLYRTTADNPTDQSIIEDTNWLMLQLTSTEVVGGKIRNTEIIIAPPWDPYSQPKAWGGARAQMKSREEVAVECQQGIVLRDSPIKPAFRAVWVRFVYRGQRDSAPWPTIKYGVRWGTSSGVRLWCPIQADWILDKVFEPSTEQVPSEQDDPTLPPAVSQEIPNVPDVGIGGKIALAGAGLLAVAVLAGYAVRSFR